MGSRVRPSVGHDSPEVSAEGGDAAGGTRVSCARRPRDQADDAVPARRQYVVGPHRRELPRRPLRRALLHLRRRRLLRAVPAGRDAGHGMPSGVDARADDLCRRRPLRAAGGRRLRCDERLQRLRSASVSGEVPGPVARGRSDRRRPDDARRGRARGQRAGAARPLLRAGLLAPRLCPQRRPRRIPAVLGHDRCAQAAGVHRAFVDADLRSRRLPRQPARTRRAARALPGAPVCGRDGSAGRLLRCERRVGIPGRRALDVHARQPVDRGDVSDHVGRHLGLPVSGSAGADPRHARPVRREQAVLGLRHAERRAFLHVSAVRRLRASLLHIPVRRREGRDPGTQHGCLARPRSPGVNDASMRTRVGVDIGGTFTDLVILDETGRVLRTKVPSTPDDYSRGIAHGLEAAFADTGLDVSHIAQVMHGTTVATNALLEGKGARVALVTTSGFRDVLEIRRLRMPVLYDIRFRKPPALVPRQWRFEVPERIDSQGRIERALDETAAASVIDRILDARIDTVAICLINAYANGVHEARLREMIRARAPDVAVSISSELVPEIREYERTSTTVVNGYVLPLVRRYLEGLDAQLSARGIGTKLTIMQSSGGAMSAAAAAERPIHIIESGPAAGVVGAAEFARRLDNASLLTFDMGGTTAKAALVEGGRFLRVNSFEVGGGINIAGRLLSGGGYHVSAPAIDIAEVGAGGGSIARIDAGGRLIVGPDSAGAEPGPACYKRGGTLPTVTDANVVLGFVNPCALAGGRLPIHRDAACAAIEMHIARPLELDLHAAAWGVHRVANAAMARALRAVSTERGHDPRKLSLLAFGGNGPVHASTLARLLDIRRILVPPAPGVFSALGMLFPDIEHHYVRTHKRGLRELDLSALEST